MVGKPLTVMGFGKFGFEMESPRRDSTISTTTYYRIKKGIEGTSETLKEAYDGGVSKIESSPPSCEHKWVVFHVKPSKFKARAQGAAI
ncbi:hypothetical protein JHK87_024895 [Glycine soja]|nr:hypothetical protein JHK87_024895 [Glycine soja]